MTTPLANADRPPGLSVPPGSAPPDEVTVTISFPPSWLNVINITGEDALRGRDAFWMKQLCAKIMIAAMPRKSPVARSPIAQLIDAATGYTEPVASGPTAEQKELAAQLGSDVLSDLRHYYPDVVRTRPTTWPTHLRNTIAQKVARLLAEQNTKPSDA